MTWTTDFIALAFHEARNVRHLIKAGAIDGQRHLRLTNLPKDKYEAWLRMKSIRGTAARVDIESAFQKFEKAFNITLDELIELFGHQAWKNNAPGYGGNQWKVIASALKRLRQAASDGDTDTVEELVETIPLMSHNTGVLCDKLIQLDAKS